MPRDPELEGIEPAAAKYEAVRSAYISSPSKPKIAELAREHGVNYETLRRMADSQEWEERRMNGIMVAGRKAAGKMLNKWQHAAMQLRMNHIALSDCMREKLVECVEHMVDGKGAPAIEKVAQGIKALGELIKIEEGLHGIAGPAGAALLGQNAQPTSSVVEITVEEGTTVEDIAQQLRGRLEETEPEDDGEEDA